MAFTTFCLICKKSPKKSIHHIPLGNYLYVVIIQGLTRGSFGELNPTPPAGLGIVLRGPSRANVLGPSKSKIPIIRTVLYYYFSNALFCSQFVYRFQIPTQLQKYCYTRFKQYNNKKACKKVRILSNGKKKGQSTEYQITKVQKA